VRRRALVIDSPDGVSGCPRTALMHTLKSVEPTVMLGNRNPFANLFMGREIELRVSDPRHADR
jgi:hypothetical protein